MRKRHQVLATVAACLVAQIALPACGLKKSGGRDASASTAAGATEVVTAPGSVGIKTAQTLVATLEAVTGVPSTTTNNVVQRPDGSVDSSLTLKQQVDLSMGFLSKSSEIGSFNPTHLLVATGMGAAFAREQIRLEAAKSASMRVLTGDVDFTKRPSEALPDAVVEKLSAKFAQRYLQRAPEAAEVAAQKSCVAGMVGDYANPGTAALNSIANQQIITGCIAAANLGSPDFLRQ